MGVRQSEIWITAFASHSKRNSLSDWKPLAFLTRRSPECYKIKLQRVGYRLVYRVEDDTIFVTVIAVGKRDKLKVYDTAKSRL
ncbi:MAG: type II toxin-antitoxin system RelE/ParE family toxin [Sulfurimicrobium sp.]|nr:type II toxin-antitoxin system RelE/ParE family toxin [Sulfurimicrobium sp.]